MIERTQALWVIYVSLGLALLTLLLPLPMQWRIVSAASLALTLFSWLLASAPRAAAAHAVGPRIAPAFN